MVEILRVKVTADRTPLIDKTVDVLTREVKERCGVEIIQAGESNSDLALDVRPGIGEQGFRIEGGPKGQVRIIGNDERGLLYGVGKFLRSSRFDGGVFTPGRWRGTSFPQKQVRGIYFATHFFNFYHVAPVEKVQRYIEELALWGCNALCVWYDMHHFAGIDDPRAQEMIERLRSLLRTASEVGMGATLGVIANEAYSDSPVELRGAAHGAYGVELCPSKPGAMPLMLKWREEMLRAFSDIDIEYFWVWPYDQGGCNCEKCAPWGANGFLRMSEPVTRLARRYFPRARIILSTWWFDEHQKGEWEGLARAFERGPDWVDYIMADSSGDFPEHPLKHGVPGGLPLLDFPEISMHGMYPWGGWGANPLPARMQGRWDLAGGHLEGGFPYSEGIYEDMNKAVALQFYWGSRPAMETVRDYSAFEFSPDAAEDLARAVQLMERNHEHKWVRQGETPERICVMQEPGVAAECFELVRRAETRMTAHAKSSWRWRIFYLRAAIDAELVRSGGAPNETVNAYLDELTSIYCMKRNTRHAPVRKSTGWSEADETARGPD